MFLVTNAFKAAMSANNRIWKIMVKVKRNDVDAPDIDITDRITDYGLSFDFERRSGTVSLEIDNYDYSLSPLNRDSQQNQVGGVYNPLLDSNHEVKVYVGILTDSGYEYIQRFTGYLGDEIDADTYPGTISVTARDKSKLMQDTYIFQSKTYGTASYGVGMTLETVIQDMVDQFLPNSGIIVTVPTPTLQTVGRPDQPYTAKDTNLWDACQLLSDAFNHELRFMEDGTLRLRKVEHDLHTVTPVITFDESMMTKDRISLSDSDVRNHIVLRVQGLDPIERKNEDSIAKYGRRYMEIRRAVANILTTQEQAHEFVDGLIKDMSYVTPVDQLELPLYPIVQIGDIVCVKNTRLGTDPTYEIFRVTRIQESFGATKKRTSLSLQGYIRVDINATPAPKPVTATNYEIVDRVIQNYPNSGWVGSEKKTYFPMIKWQAPTQDVTNANLALEFGGYTIYRKHSSESNYYPIASIKSYIAPLNLKVNYFYDYTAKAGISAYKIVALNKFGKTSTEATLSVNVPQTTII